MLFVVWLISKWGVGTPDKIISADLDSISSKGRLVVAINANKTDYFLYNGEPKGFQFDLLQSLGNYLGLKIEVLVNSNPDDNISMLKSGDCDLVASSWNYSKNSEQNVSLSQPLLETELVLVQRKPSDLIVSSDKKEDVLVRDINAVKGLSIYVPFQSGEAFSLKQVNRNLAHKLNIYEMPQFSQNKLVELVASGELDYTVCNNILAHSLKTQYPELDFETVIKRSEPIVWNIRKSSPKLMQKVNQWISRIKESKDFAVLTDKYFTNRASWFPADYALNSFNTGRLSRYDSYIKKYSHIINWDWRLLASLIYQESRFKPDIRSRRGAWGLMQMMPATQIFFGVDSSATPERQILAGVRYIKFLDNVFSKRVPDPEERINFILASYNIGPGHIFDAQKIARKSGKDPLKWFQNVDSCLLSKSQPENYTDPDIQFGYCRGVETYNFVNEILNRFQHYKNIMD